MKAVIIEKGGNERVLSSWRCEFLLKHFIRKHLNGNEAFEATALGLWLTERLPEAVSVAVEDD